MVFIYRHALFPNIWIGRPLSPVFINYIRSVNCYNTLNIASGQSDASGIPVLRDEIHGVSETTNV